MTPLEPHFDKQTMEIHHTKHHQAYVNNANAALESLPEFADLSVEELITKLDQLPADKKGPLRNNAGGHANHSLFWKGLKNRYHPAGRPESGYRARFRLR
nr:superoxide dismutase [Raoultella sp. NCTC 9187]